MNFDSNFSYLSSLHESGFNGSNFSDDSATQLEFIRANIKKTLKRHTNGNSFKSTSNGIFKSHAQYQQAYWTQIPEKMRKLETPITVAPIPTYNEITQSIQTIILNKNLFHIQQINPKFRNHLKLQHANHNVIDSDKKIKSQSTSTSQNSLFTSFWVDGLIWMIKRPFSLDDTGSSHYDGDWATPDEEFLGPKITRSKIDSPLTYPELDSEEIGRAKEGFSLQTWGPSHLMLEGAFAAEKTLNNVGQELKRLGSKAMQMLCEPENEKDTAMAVAQAGISVAASTGAAILPCAMYISNKGHIQDAINGQNEESLQEFLDKQGGPRNAGATNELENKEQLTDEHYQKRFFNLSNQVARVAAQQFDSDNPIPFVRGARRAINPRLFPQDFANPHARRKVQWERTPIKNPQNGEAIPRSREPINPVSNSRSEIEKQFGAQLAVKKHRKKCLTTVLPTGYVNGANGPRAAEGVDLIDETDECGGDAPINYDETRML